MYNPERTPPPLYNGNIAQTWWRTANDPSNKRGYGYDYDPLNRLHNANYLTPLALGIQTEDYFEGDIHYDQNGNITSLHRKGLTPESTIDYIDKLSYSYYPASNKLKAVNDAAGTAGFKKGTVPADYDYTYDDNGNMITDANKNIISITYNHLNLPVMINFGSVRGAHPNNIEYVYDATGVKQQKIVHTADLLIWAATDYANGYIYERPLTSGPFNLKFFSHPEGYVSKETDGTFSYIYQYKDHLGNVRLSYTDANNNGAISTNEIVEESNYYPFGLKHNGYNNAINSLGSSTAQKYKYNGKEYQDELGLNLYDYGARNYDPAIGRWMNLDPLAEQSRRWSPYNYAYNNPVYFIDPDGMQAIAGEGDDWYIDDRTGEVLGSDGAATDNARLIDQRDYEEIKSNNNGSTTSSEATNQLQQISMIICANDSQIQNEVQDITDLSINQEHQTDIVLNKYNAEISAVRGNPGTADGAEIDARDAPSGALLASNGSFLLANVHGHPLTKVKGQQNVTGTSDTDKATALDLGITIYATDAYNTMAGKSATIGKTSGGTSTSNVGKTKGTGQGTFNLGLDALNKFKPKK